jgi:hypothetical protein
MDKNVLICVCKGLVGAGVLTVDGGETAGGASGVVDGGETAGGASGVVDGGEIAGGASVVVAAGWFTGVPSAPKICTDGIDMNMDSRAPVAGPAVYEIPKTLSTSADVFDQQRIGDAADENSKTSGLPVSMPLPRGSVVVDGTVCCGVSPESGSMVAKILLC